jgi:hypothetical protein
MTERKSARVDERSLFAVDSLPVLSGRAVRIGSRPCTKEGRESPLMRSNASTTEQVTTFRQSDWRYPS